MLKYLLQFIFTLLIISFPFSHVSAQAGLDSLGIMSLSPDANQVGVAPNAVISITFDRSVAGLDFNESNFILYGARAGRISGSFSRPNDSTIVFTPTGGFAVNDRITAVLARRGSTNLGVLDEGFVWEFDVAPVAGSSDFQSLYFSTDLRLSSIVAAELNGDDKMDVVYAGETNGGSVLETAYFQNGQFVPDSRIDLPDRVRPLYTADFNADGLPDFLLLHRGTDKYSIEPRISLCFLLPNGNLSLEQTILIGDTQSGFAEPRGAAVNDFNQDGFLDFVVLVRNDLARKAAFVYLNDGTGHFAEFPNVPWFDRTNNAESIFGRDLNNSGFVDIGIGHSTSSAYLGLFLNPGNADFPSNVPDRYLLTGQNRDFELSASVDLTNDNLPDVLAVDFSGNEVLLYQNQGTTTVFTRDIPVPVFPATPDIYPSLTHPNWLEYGDIDADNDIDLALTGSRLDTLEILLNDERTFSRSLRLPIFGNPINFTTSDFNGDGALDFIVADTTGALTLLLNNAEGYEPPETPVLLSPVDEKIVPADSLIFKWQVPSDPNVNDVLHFRITFTSEIGDSIAYDSFTNPELFSPQPPVAQGQGIITFIPPAFNDGYYSWTVEAWDGQLWSEPSTRWQFTVDVTPPSDVQMSFPKAIFDDKWFAVQGSSPIFADLSYSESAADYAIVTTNGIGGPFTFTDIPSGDNATTEISFVPDASPDGEYSVQAEVFDKAGLSGSTFATVGVDRNAPSGGTASVATDTSATRDFRVSWGGATDGTGSGLSGFYRVQYRVDGGAWNLWIASSNATDSLFQGRDGHTYEFEASAYDNVGYVEPFTDTPEARTTVDVFVNDKTAPPPPLNVRANGANPSPWQSGADFTVYWDLPADESGIKESFWKLGDPPASINDFDAKGAPKGPAPISLNTDGIFTLYIWLSDSAGNVDYNNTATINLRRDSTLPTLNTLTITSPNQRTVDALGNAWYNTAVDKNFAVNLGYSEINPETAVLTTDGLTDSLINEGADLPKGTNVSTAFNFSVTTPADRLYTLKATLIDSAENRSSKNLRIGLDGTPPRNSLAAAPAISATEAFPVSWSAGTDGTGSGVASYNLYYKEGSGSWQFWFTTTQPGDSTFVGQNGSEYRFEAVARDSVGLEEPLSATGEAKVLVDLSANDNDPPPPPVNLRANGSSPASPWSKTSPFTITWTAPDDESGVVGSYWKLGAAPVSNSDTSGVGGSGPAEGSMSVPVSTPGKQWLYVWLIDAKGNVDFNNADSVLLRFDNKPPTISGTRFLNPGYGDDWFNSNTADSARFEVTYNEQFADIFKLNSVDLNYNIQDANPQSGVGVKKNVSLALDKRPDQSGLLTVTLTDSAGNVTEVVDTLRIDSTPSENSRAESPQVSGATSFQVTWSTGEDAGVGVSDTFDVYVKVNNDGWTRWQHNITEQSAFYNNAEDGNTYHFEAVSRDWLGNMEIRTYEHESTTLVNVALNDSLAPKAPIDLRASGSNPSPWQKSATFSITWQAPDDPSGTPKAWYKLGARPRNNTDTTGSFVGQPPMPITVSTEGRQTLFVWLEDGAQNTDFRQSASVVLRYDRTAPRIDSLVLANPRPAFIGDDVSWYNPTVPPHKSSFNVYFTEKYAANVLLQPSALFQSSSIVPQPNADSVNFDLGFAGFADNIVTLDVSVSDSAGNAADDNLKIGLDSTSPLNTLAQSPDTTRPGDFLVSWDVSRVIEKGSGLSGIFDVRVKIDDGDWILWQPRYEGTSIYYKGEVGHTYYFEVAAYDNVGNKENFKSQAESITTVVEQFEDNIAPGAPTNITINGFQEPIWSNSSEFEVNWTSPSDPSGIAIIYYKFYQAPTRSDDFNGSASGTPPISIEFTDDGIVPIYFWLQDGAGNSDFTKNGRAVIKYDGTPPHITKSLVTNAVYDDQWLNPDSTTLAQIRLTYTEANPDSMRLYFGDAIVNEQQNDIPVGKDVDIDFVISLQDVNDGCYPLITVLQDSAGNVETDTLLVCLDSTPPEGATASSPERSVSNKFTVTWAGEGLGSDGEGSGLSGEYDLRMRIGDGQWFEVFTRTKTTSFLYVGVHGNVFSFEVAAWDNTGNREVFTGLSETTTLVDTAFVDQTAPDAPVDVTVRGKNPSPWQNQPQFKVQWRNPIDPSGIRTAFLKFDQPPTSTADYTDSASVETDDGLVDLTISEEDGRLLYIWLEDGRGNVDHTKTASIWLNYDATKPTISFVQSQHPAFQNNWYNQELTPTIVFDVIFDEKHPDSLFVYADSLIEKRVKLTTQNTFVDTARVTLNLAEASDGDYLFYFEVADSARNISFEDSMQIHLDSRAPRITHTFADTVVLANTAIPIQATAADANPLQDIKLIYWQGGEREHQSIDMTLVSDSTYQAEIPASVVGDRGIEYLILASDGVNQNRFPLSPEIKKPLALRVQLTDGIAMPEPLAYGSDENAYRLLAFPLDLQNPAPAAVLEPKLGAYDDTYWRFFQWNPAESIFQEYANIEKLRHGKAYWIITTKQNIQLESGPGLTVNTIKPYTVVLKKGWNDIGLPFNFPVDWNDIIASSAIDTQKVQGPHGYSGRWEYPFENSILQPWIGYSVYSDEDDISIIIPPLEAPPALAKSDRFASLGKLDWAFEIKAQSREMVDAANIFGCAKNATNAWDYGYDFIEAPEVGSYVSLYFEHEDWTPRAERFTSDIRPPQKGYIWEFSIESNKTQEAVKLSFRALDELPQSLEVRLVDEVSSMSLDLTQDSTYTFQFSKNEDVRQFKIYAGDPEFMQSQESALATVPKQSEPVVNYPNPFNSSTVISYEIKSDCNVNLAVYNLLAQKVRQLRNEFQEKGFYQMSWNARDDNGRELGTGVYIIRLETPDFTYTRKMVYMR